MKLVNPVYGNGLIYEDISTSNAGTRTAVTTSLYYHYDHLGSTTALTDASGQVTGRYSYGTYGEALSGSREKTPYLYNGKLGVMTDENSLYYMRSRYYNVSIKRFMNRDTLRGDMSNSQSLNRYSYVQGNPVSYTDPFGTSPYADVSTFGHSLLNLLGMIPVAGDICDLANMAWYLSEGNLKMAGVCALSALPMMGTMAGGALNICKLSKAARYTRTIACTVGYGYTTFVATDATINHGKEAYRSYRETGFSKETSKAVAGFTISLACAVLSGKATVDNLSSTARMLSADTRIRNSNLGLNNQEISGLAGKGAYEVSEGGGFSESGRTSGYDRTGYQSSGRSNNLFGRDRSTRRTTNLTEWRRSISKQDIHYEMRIFLGDDYVKIDSGKWRSLDGTRQFRVKPDDYLGNHGIGQPIVPNIPHVHFEFLTPISNGNGFDVIKNIHVPIK